MPIKHIKDIHLHKKKHFFFFLGARFLLNFCPGFFFGVRAGFRGGGARANDFLVFVGITILYLV